MKYTAFGKTFDLDLGKDTAQFGSAYSGVTSFIGSIDTAQAYLEKGIFDQQGYYQKASLIKSNAYRTRARQAMDYISSGVKLVGTPLLVLKGTMELAKAQADSYMQAGDQAFRISAHNARNAAHEGRAAIIKSILDIGSLEL